MPYEGNGEERVTLSFEEIGEVIQLIGTLDVEEVDLTVGDVRILVRRHSSRGPAPADAVAAPEPAAAEVRSVERVSAPNEGPAPQPAASADGGEDGELAEWLKREASGEVVLVRSPMAGVFYRAKEPGADPFVSVGDTVEPDDTVCLVEVMKLFHSISAGSAGRVEAILVEDGAVVENGQPLVVLRVQ